MWPTSEVRNIVISNYVQMNDEARSYLPVNSVILDFAKLDRVCKHQRWQKVEWHKNVIIRSYVVKDVI